MLHAVVSEQAEDLPGREAVIQGNRRVTYGELELHISRMASFLAGNGAQKGERIGVMNRNSPEYIAAYLGVQRAGCAAVDIPLQATMHEVRTIVDHCGIGTLIVENSSLETACEAVRKAPSIRTIVGMERRARGLSSFGKKVPEEVRYVLLNDVIGGKYGRCSLPDVAGQDLASIVYDTHAAGKPKGVMLSHDNVMANTRSITECLQLGAGDRMMVVLPFCHSFGKSMLATHLMSGATLVLENSFTNPDQVFEKMAQEEVTGFACVPATVAIMLNRSNFRKYRFPKLRYVILSGGAMPPQHVRELAGILPGTKISILYGRTEATAQLTCLDTPDLLTRPDSIGRPLPGVEIDLAPGEQGATTRVGRRGEIVARGRNVMIGYWNDPEATGKVLKEGRLYTGDIGRMDPDGYLYFVGRKSDMIRCGDHLVSPKEIEDVLHEMEEIHEANVVGVPDARQGEAIRAVVVLKEGRKLDAKKVRRHCRTRLLSCMVPKEVYFVDSVPKTSSGEVMRSLLKSNLIAVHVRGPESAATQ